MRIILMALTAVLCCTMTTQAQLLYRISGNGLKEASYILGTCHTADISFVDSIPGLRKVMNITQQVYGETSMDGSSDTSDVELDKLMLLPDGMRLDSLLTDDEMKRLTAFMIDKCKMDTDRVRSYYDVKPFPLAFYLALKCDEFDKTETSNGDRTFDAYFQKEALAQGKEIGGLESANSQYRLLYTFPLDRQKDLLMCMVDNHQRPEAEGSALYTYYSQNLDAIWKEHFDNLDDDCSYTLQESAKLLDTRNLAWMKKIPSVMSQKPTLFVVGSLHLPGPNGILSLLRQAGYKVKAVKK